MSGVYDQQIRKLIEHINSLNHALHERNMQIVQWQQVARAMQEERARVARGLLESVRQALTTFAGKFQGLRAENKKLRSYIEHLKQLHEVVARDMHGQLQYALTRIDELARERAEWREEINATQLGALRQQQQVAEQKGVIASQQSAVAEMRQQLEIAARFSDMHQQLEQQRDQLEIDLMAKDKEHAATEQALGSKDRELRKVVDAFEAFKIRATEAHEALKAQATEQIQALQQQLRDNQHAQSSVDERINDMTSLLANSEREVAKLYKELTEDRNMRKEAEIRLEATSKELLSAKRKVGRLEKERETAKGERMGDLQKQLVEMQKSNDAMQERYEALQAELARALQDKTSYMQALEGQKGKLRPLPPAADQKE